MLKNQLYSYIKDYFEEYLHGFTKRQLDVAITKGQIKLQYLNLRPDSVNKKMDEKNIPFWIKAGLIKKINISFSVMNIIGEIPLEIKIDGLDIILNPSYKWIVKNKDSYVESFLDSKFINEILNLNQINPEIELKRRYENYDTSIFTKQVKELFKDKTVISNILNIFYEKCYDYYNNKASQISIKLKNIHLRIEDDYLFNYNGNLVLGIRIDSVDLKYCKKGNMKKNTIKISKLDIYWENHAKILIPSDFLHSLFINGQLQESYYSQIQDLKFQNFNYQRNTKFILENFNITINFGTKLIDYSKSIDIFNIKDKPLILYIQASTSELNINIWPELFLIFDNFMKFKQKFKIIEKIKEFKPKMKPINKFQNNNDISIENKKLIVRNWFYYFLFCQKMTNYINNKNKNPLREEFLRYYNIFCKRADINTQMEVLKEKENKDLDNEDKFNKNNIGNQNDISNNAYQNNNNELKKEDNNMKKSNINLIPHPNGRNNNSNSNTNILNINAFLNEQKRKQFEENTKLKQINLSFISDILIKAININIYPSVEKENLNYLIFKINDISSKVILSKEKFELNISTKTIDFGPFNLIYGERVLLCPESYRKLYQNPYSNNNKEEYDTIENRKYPLFSETEYLMDEINNDIINNPQNFNDQGNNNKIKQTIDVLNLDEINNNKKRSRGSSFCSGYRNGLNMENSNANFNNNIINVYSNKGINNRPLNTVGNNYYSNNYNQILNSKPNILLDNSVQNNIYNKKSFIKQTIAKKSDISLLENFDEIPLLTQNKLNKKQRNELDISQAVNNYNSYKLKQQRSNTPVSSISPIKMRMNNKNKPFSNSNIPLNLLEIYSNTNTYSFIISYVKYNNPVSIDNFRVEIGTIRSNLFYNYLSESLKILNEYTKVFHYETKKKFLENFFKEDTIENSRQLYHAKKYFYKNIALLPDEEKTESMVRYGEYLRKEISLMKIFNTKVEDFNLNYLFSYFNNGIRFHFSFENLECVYYNKYNKMSGKFIFPMNEIDIIISIKKIILNILGMQLEINDLEDSKWILKKIKKLFDHKFFMFEIVLEPCYSLLKQELYRNSSNDINYTNNNENIQNKIINQNEINIIKEKNIGNKDMIDYSNTVFFDNKKEIKKINNGNDNENYIYFEEDKK